MLIYTNKTSLSQYLEDKNVKPEIIKQNEKDSILRVHLAGKYSGKIIETTKIETCTRYKCGDFLFVSTSGGKSHWVFFDNGVDDRFNSQDCYLMGNTLGIPQCTKIRLFDDEYANLYFSCNGKEYALGKLLDSQMKSLGEFKIICERGTIAIAC